MPSSNKPKVKNNIHCNIVSTISFTPELFIETVLAHLAIENASLEFTFFDNASIHEMNKTYLNHDWPTDIITFDLSEDSGEVAKTSPLEGDLYISVEQASIQASSLGHSLEKELKIVIIHGILHLLGYDDQTPEDQSEMDAKQHQIYDLLHTPA